MFNAPFLFAFMLMFCFLLISEIPMFSLKFKSYAMNEKENVLRYGYLICCLLILFVAGAMAEAGHTWQMLSRGLAICILLYVGVSIAQKIGSIYGTDRRS